MLYGKRLGTAPGRWPRPRLPQLLLPVLVLACSTLLTGCSTVSGGLLHPHGAVALAERNIFLFITAVTLVVVLPVFVLTAWVVIRYRAGRARGSYQPNWGHSTGIDLGIWGTAGLAAVVIASTIWVTTHRWDPYEPVGPNADPPLTVQVIAEDWKWLFVYPKQDMAGRGHPRGARSDRVPPERRNASVSRRREPVAPRVRVLCMGSRRLGRRAPLHG